MNNYPSSMFISKLESSFLLEDPQEQFVIGLRNILVEHAKELTVKSVDNKKNVKKPASVVFPHKTWVVIGLVLVVLITAFIFRQPVLAAIGRLFGYGYLPEIGFVQLDTTRVLRNPVIQETEESHLTVLYGLADPERTILWLSFDDEAQPGDGAWLETPAGERVDLLYWDWETTRTNPQGVRLEFPPLSSDISQVTLALPQGWRLPLEWIPATQAGIPSAEINAPYPTLHANSASSSSNDPSQPCLPASELQVCLKAAHLDGQGAHVLLEAVSLGNQLTPGSLFGGVIETNPINADMKIQLSDDLGNSVLYPEVPFEATQSEGDHLLQPLTFPVLSTAAQYWTLRVPAFGATTIFSEPLELTVDLGSDPQPGQVLSVNQELTILGQSIRFTQATLEGDGVTSLRVKLLSEPQSENQAWIIVGLDLGKPEGIDDRYGSGFNAQAQVVVSSELIGTISGKKTGLLTFPVIGARVILPGPFEFVVPAPAMVVDSPSETPAVVDGSNFIPQPTPTSIALDGYQYSGRAIQAGDLLFTVVGESDTLLYAAHPSTDFVPELIATLPGQVYQFFIHPDRLGLDYLVGEKVSEDGFSFYRSPRLFSLRFTDSLPQQLFAFQRGSDQVKGTELLATWSVDGKLMVFSSTGFVPKPGEATNKMGWFDLACRDSGDCQPEYLQLPAGLAINPYELALDGYRLLLQGSYINGIGSGAGDVFLVNFNSRLQPEPIQNLTNSDQVNEESPQWLPDGSGFFSACTDNETPINEYNLCRHGVSGEQNETLFRLPFNMHRFIISPDGKMLLDLVLVPDIEQDRQTLQLFNIDTRHTTIVKQHKDLYLDVHNFSPDSRYLGFVWSEGGKLSVIQLDTGEEYNLSDAVEMGTISWLLWVNIAQ
ncbi:MAG: hypothetical protein GYA52_06055 [Chloroflexi bacterium]|nr:hypothetical protein [Chloroflexota bacterium]